MTDCPCSLPVVVGIAVCGLASFVLLKNRTKKSDEMSSNAMSIHDSTDSNFEARHLFPNDPKFGKCIYLDWNATTPVFPEVFKAMTPFLTTCFGNPSSSHVFSRPCRDAITESRNNIGALINAQQPLIEIYFTSCGTESDNRAIDIALFNYSQKIISKSNFHPIPHVITCVTEHPAIIAYLRALVERGQIALTVLGGNGEGYVSVNEIKNSLLKNTGALILYRLCPISALWIK